MSTTYHIPIFLDSADPAPVHTIPVPATSAGTIVSSETSVFVPKERGELIPLQRRRVKQPEKWLNKVRSFDKTWGETIEVGEDGQVKHSVPLCTIHNCKLDCGRLTDTIVSHARNLYYAAAKRGVNDQTSWLNLQIRPIKENIVL